MIAMGNASLCMKSVIRERVDIFLTHLIHLTLELGFRWDTFDIIHAYGNVHVIETTMSSVKSSSFL